MRITGDLQAEAIFVFRLVPDAFSAADASVVHRRIFDHLNRQSTAWAYYDTFSTRNVTEMIGVTGRYADRSTKRVIWFDGREVGDARAVAVTAALVASTHLRQEPEGYALRIAVWTVDPLNVGPTGVVWTRSQHEPPEIVTVRFRRGAAAE